MITKIDMKDVYINSVQLRRVLSANIKARRRALGISQEKLAELADLSVQMINSIEGCRAWISDKTLVTLANVLGIEVFQLFTPQAIMENQVKPDDEPLTYWLIKLQQDMKAAVDADIDAHFARFFNMISQSNEQ